MTPLPDNALAALERARQAQERFERRIDVQLRIPPILAQFNNGVCDSCGGELRESPYCGGDHDEIAECRACGKHFGCWACENHR